MTPEAADVDRNNLEVRLAGGLLALNRLLMTLQNKRMPLTDVEISGNPQETRAGLVLECPEDSARRYAKVLEALEDVQEVRFSRAASPERSGA